MGHESEQCPKCGKWLYALASYDAQLSSVRVERSGDPDLQEYYDTDSTTWPPLEWLSDFLAWHWAGIRQRRLNGVLRAYPNSVICAGCGFLLRRR